MKTADQPSPRPGFPVFDAIFSLCSAQRSEKRHFVIVESRKIGGQTKIPVEIVRERRASAMHVTDAIVVRRGHRAPERVAEKPFDPRSVATTSLVPSVALANRMRIGSGLRLRRRCRLRRKRFGCSGLVAPHSGRWLRNGLGSRLGVRAGVGCGRMRRRQRQALSVPVSAVAFAALSASTSRPSCQCKRYHGDFNRVANLHSCPHSFRTCCIALAGKLSIAFDQLGPPLLLKIVLWSRYVVHGVDHRHRRAHGKNARGCSAWSPSRTCPGRGEGNSRRRDNPARPPCRRPLD